MIAMLSIGQRNELRQAAEIRRTSRATHCGGVADKPAISETADLTSGNQGQTNDRSMDASGRDRLKAPRGIGLAVVLAVVFVWLPFLWAIWPKH